MSLLMCCFRSHFIKHLTCTSLFLSTFHAHHFTTHSKLNSSCYSLCQLKKRLSLRKFGSMNATPSSSENCSTASSTSPYLSVHIRCSRDFADMFSEALLCFGASSTSIDEQDSDDRNEKVSISSIYDISEDVQKSISHAADSIGLKDIPSYKVVKGYHSDWIKEIQESFHPVEVTEGLWIVPEWRTPLDNKATNIILNPGLAFGTGDHPTTKLCLLVLHDLIKGGESLLDYGTGSGILAIAAIKLRHYGNCVKSYSARNKPPRGLISGSQRKLILPVCKNLLRLNGKINCCSKNQSFLKLVAPVCIEASLALKRLLQFGAAFAVGFDIDTQAITAARHNATLNKIGPDVLQWHLVSSERTHSRPAGVLDGHNSQKTKATYGAENSQETKATYGAEKYDIVVANILLYPLLDLADQIVSFAKPGAVVALSGIISEQVPRIIERYSEHLDGVTVSKMDDWACVAGTKKIVLAEEKLRFSCI